MNETIESIFAVTSDSDMSTRSPQESSNHGMRAAPKRIFHVITFRLSTVTGPSVLDAAVNVTAFWISSNVVTRGRQEKRTITVRETVKYFKLELPVEGYDIGLSMNSKTKMFVYCIHKTKIKMDRPN